MVTDYHGIVVENGLQDPSILERASILGRKTAGDWSLVRVCVAPGNIDATVEKIRRNLRSVSEVPFYAHFYRGRELVVVFPERVFRLSTDRATWGPAIEYGRSKGIPSEELDFYPCRVEDETF